MAQFDPKVKIPYFSSIPSPFGLGSNIINQLLDDLIHIISFVLSDENRPNLESWFSNMDDVCVSIDVIGYLCEAFEISPKVSSRMVNIWHDKVTDLWQINKNDDSFKETDLYKNVLMAFNRLNHVAEKYPPKWIK